jgi:DNA transposition AAA+ family ATPase
MMPELVLATLGAGMGKTETVRRYVSERPHAYMVTMRPKTSKVNAMLLEIAQALDVPPAERAHSRIDRAIGMKLKRNGRQTLLIVDEAQNLIDKAVDQLRYFLDEYGVGIALIGNEELYGRFGGKEPTPAYAQLHRRFGLRLRRMQPLAGDIDAQIAAWGIEDSEIRKLAQAIGRKPGALGQVTKTLQLAGMYAAGEQRPMAAADVRAALKNRGLEE